MKNVAVDMKNKDIVDRMNETSANLKIVNQDNDLERTLLENKFRVSYDDNDVLGEKKMFGLLAEFIEGLKRDFINIYKYMIAGEINKELQKNAEHLSKEKIIEELIKEIQENERLTADEKKKIELQLQDPENQENVARIVNSNLDRFNSYLSENLDKAMTEEDKERILEDGYRKTQINEEDILARDKEKDRQDDRQDDKFGDKESDTQKQAIKAESRISRMRKQ